MNLTNKLLEVNNKFKSYYSIDSETKALNNITFDLYKNEFLGIIGPSGCGKSSILNIISGIDKKYFGKIIKKDNIKIGYMLQEHALLPYLTVLDNALLGLRISKKLNIDNKNYVLNLLKKYNLIEFKDKYPHELSGGMKQRLALIRTLALKPDILLLDEPFSALDAQTRLQVSDDVYKIIKNENKTIIIVTHDLSEAISICDKIILLSDRPSKIKNIYEINYSNKELPTENRKKNEFIYYYDLLWSDINS